MVLAGFAVLAVSGVTAALPIGGAILAIPLFLLGVGWNLGFVAGSSLLASEAPLGDRARLQGASDALVWSTAAAASFVSGYVVLTASYAVLAAAGAALAVLLAVTVAVDNRSSRAIPA